MNLSFYLFSSFDFTHNSVFLTKLSLLAAAFYCDKEFRNIDLFLF